MDWFHSAGSDGFDVDCADTGFHSILPRQEVVALDEGMPSTPLGVFHDTMSDSTYFERQNRWAFRVKAVFTSPLVPSGSESSDNFV